MGRNLGAALPVRCQVTEERPAFRLLFPPCTVNAFQNSIEKSLPSEASSLSLTRSRSYSPPRDIFYFNSFFLVCRARALPEGRRNGEHLGPPMYVFACAFFLCAYFLGRLRLHRGVQGGFSPSRGSCVLLTLSPWGWAGWGS